MSKSWTTIAKDYAKSALAKKNSKKFGKWVKLACQRFLDDLDRCKRKDRAFYYSEEEAERACDFASNLPHVEGKWKTDLIVLEPFQVFFLCNLFGFRKLSGARRFTSAMYACSRKNGKSALASIIGLYCLTIEDEKGPQVISAATTGDQAAIVFNAAKKMIDRKIGRAHV